MGEEKWGRFITPYMKDYCVDGTNLSTFTNLFTNFKHTTPAATITECEECEKYISKLQEKALMNRAEYN
jgi:hypothetical protein